MSLRRSVVLCSLLFAGAAVALAARQSPASSSPLFAEMRWRNIGPYRGGRTKAVAGVPGQPYTFYIGVVNGGVWKTTDAGRTWMPIFDDQPTGSIGAIAVAPSDPNIIYVGSGEGLQRPDLSIGDGIYKSTDAGKTWTHLGLRDAQQIPKIVVDPKNPDRLFVAVLGHPYGPNAERGIFRSTDGGRSFQKVLYKDENTGGKDVDIDPVQSRTSSTPSLWEARQGPWENAAWSGAGGGLFKSTDGGDTWKQLTKGCRRSRRPLSPSRRAIRTALCDRCGRFVGRAGPSAGSGRADAVRAVAEVAAAGRARPQRAPIYRSDDGGETWTRITTDTRPASRTDEAEVVVDPKNPDTIIVTDVVTYKSTDGGKTLRAVQGRARRRRLSERLDQPERPEHHAARERPGRGRHRSTAARRGAPGTTSRPRVLPRDDRQRVSVSRVRRPAGQRLGVRREPRRRRPDHVPRVAPGRRRGVRLRRAGSARSRHRLRRQGDALRPAHRTGVERRSARRPRRRRPAGDTGAVVPHGAHAAGRVLAGRPARAVLRARTCCGRRSTAA